MWLFILLIVLLCVLFGWWAADSWAQAHALCVLEGGQWYRAAQGWQVIFTFVGVFFGAGVLLGCGLGFLAGMPLKALFKKRMNEKLEQDRTQVQEELKKLQTERVEVDRARRGLADSVQEASYQNNRQAWEAAARLDIEKREAEQRVRQLEEKNRQLVGRLRGAQGKTARLNKRAQLRSPSGTKRA